MLHDMSLNGQHFVYYYKTEGVIGIYWNIPSDHSRTFQSTIPFHNRRVQTRYSFLFVSQLQSTIEAGSPFPAIQTWLVNNGHDIGIFHTDVCTNSLLFEVLCSDVKALASIADRLFVINLVFLIMSKVLINLTRILILVMFFFHTSNFKMVYYLTELLMLHHTSSISM